MNVKRYLFYNRFEIQKRISEEELLLQPKDLTPEEKRNWVIPSLLFLFVVFVVGISYSYYQFSNLLIILPIIIGISLLVVIFIILLRKPARSEIFITDSKVMIRYYYFQKFINEDVYFKENVLISFFTRNFPYPNSFSSHILLKIGKEVFDLLFFVTEFHNALTYFETLKEYKIAFDENAEIVLEFLRENVGNNSLKESL